MAQSNSLKTSDAELTVRFAIQDALISNWHKRDEMTTLRNAVFDNIFAPHLRWAIEEYLKEIK